MMKNKRKITLSAIRLNVRAGFTIIELAAVIVVVAGLTFVLMPAFVNALSGAEMTMLGSRGKTIYTAITSANSERQIMRSQSVWPARGAFTNSTDYFRYLFDEEHYGKPDWAPKVPGFNYALLAGSGVPQCRNNKLTPVYNAWIIAECLTDEWGEVMPVLVTRNVDASSLASPGTMTNSHWRLRFDTAWDTPFGKKAMVMVRRNGAIFKGRAKYLNYATVYKNTCQDSHRVDNIEVISPNLPVAYLTPSGTVAPGPESYTDGLTRQLKQRQDLCWRMSKDFKAFKVIAPIAATGWGTGYLILFIGWIVICRIRNRIAQFSLSRTLFTVAHYCLTVLYSVILASYVSANRRWFPISIVALALVIQCVLIVCVTMKTEPKQKQRASGLIYALSPLLIVCGISWGLLLFAMIV
jgi:type II secretory pathway pseudopilin PulG